MADDDKRLRQMKEARKLDIYAILFSTLGLLAIILGVETATPQTAILIGGMCAVGASIIRAQWAYP